MSQKTINPLQLKMVQIQIERVHEFNFLGLTINEHLNCRDYIDKISNKISKTMGILNKLKHFLPKEAICVSYMYHKIDEFNNYVTIRYHQINSPVMEN